MKTIELSDGCFDELLRAMKTASFAVVVSATPSTDWTTKPDTIFPPELITATATPTVQLADNNWREVAYSAALKAGYSKAVLIDWDHNSGIVFDTANQGPVGEKGIVIASFVAKGPSNNALAQIDAIGYPSPNQGNQLTLSISTVPADFSVSEEAISKSYAPTLLYCVGDKPPKRFWDNKPTAVALKEGTRYFVNVTGRDTYEPGKFGGPEFRVALRTPER